MEKLRWTDQQCSRPQGGTWGQHTPFAAITVGWWMGNSAPKVHSERVPLEVVDLGRFFQGERELHFVGCRPCYILMCYTTGLMLFKSTVISLKRHFF